MKGLIAFMQNLDALYRGGIIHDIGKIGVPDAVLLKPGPLDANEIVLMRAHPEIGENIVRPLRSGWDLLPIIRHHHEAYDGRGYPDGLAGTAIPLPARIVAVCDAYDALTNDRPYRKRLSEREAIRRRRQTVGPTARQPVDGRDPGPPPARRGLR